MNDKKQTPFEPTLPQDDLPHIEIDGLNEPATETQAQDPLAALNAENEILNAQIIELKDKMLRALAESENTRRRAQLDIADTRAYAVTSFAKDMVNVYDNLQRALGIEEDKTSAFVQGIEMTAKELLKALEKAGVKELAPLGEKFNPHFHQAMFEIPTEEAAPGTVMQILQTGFTIGERVLRPALVGVAKKS